MSIDGLTSQWQGEEQLFFRKVPALWGKLNIDFLTVSGLWFVPGTQEYTVTPLAYVVKKKKKNGQKI